MDDWLQVLLRFLHYSALLGLFGLTGYKVVGLRWLSATNQSVWFDRALIGSAVLAPLLSAALMLQSIAAMMGQSVWSTDWATVESLITTTSLGWAFVARMALLSAALTALLLRRRFRFAWATSAAFYGLAVASFSWSGHAAGLEGILGLFHRFNDTVHLLAAGLWLGAIGWFLHLTVTAHRQPDAMPYEPLLVAMHRFAPLGIALVALVGVTGMVNAQMIFGLPNSSVVLSTSYGQLLATKVLLVAFMLLCGFRNAVVGRRWATASTGLEYDPASTLASLRSSLAIEVSLAVVVIGLVAMIGMLSPIS